MATSDFVAYILGQRYSDAIYIPQIIHLCFYITSMSSSILHYEMWSMMRVEHTHICTLHCVHVCVRVLRLCVHVCVFVCVCISVHVLVLVCIRTTDSTIL